MNKFSKIVVTGATVAVVLVGGVAVGAAASTALGSSHPDTVVTEAPTSFETNSLGQSYGSALGVAHDQEPDLIEVEATNGKTGYALKTDLDAGSASTPEEAAKLAASRPAERSIPVYESDGKTVVGEFLITPSETVVVDSSGEG